MSIRLPAVSRLHRTVFGRNSLARSPWILALLLFAPLGLGPLSWTQLEAQSSQQPTAHGESLRPVVSGSRGVVASNHPRASAAGIEVLMQGGNAFDAAIATGAALGVVEPFMSGLGGVGWMIFYHAQSGEVRVLNFSGRSPADLRASFYEDAIDARGPLSMLVPGSAAAWQALVDEGYATLPPAELLEPAIRLAEGGYPITAFGLSNHASSEALFRNWDGVAASTWWGESAAVPTLGQMIRNENLGG
jgi:gamma-glutamyltranspeptidase